MQSHYQLGARCLVYRDWYVDLFGSLEQSPRLFDDSLLPFSGTGEQMTASLCWPNTNFDSKITVYSGDCNGVMNCINANDDASGNFGACALNRQASRVQWESEEGVTYYLLIHGFGARAGDFTLNVINRTPLNDRCENAEDISPGDMVIGTTFQATFPFDGETSKW
jgi:hypothetical protein